MGTFSITTYNKQLVILYNSEEGDEIQLSSITFFNPSVEVKGNKFSFFESGTYKKSISFKEIYLINDVEPTDSEDAFNKIIEGIANFNRGGAAPYKVYTALLTQNGVDNLETLIDEPLTVGVTYKIGDQAGGTWDFTNVGAPNNDIDTYFVATGTTPNSWGNGTLIYNTGAPVVTVLENTIGIAPVFTYNSVGQYQIEFPVAFPIAEGADKIATFFTTRNTINSTSVVNNFPYTSTFSIYTVALFSFGPFTAGQFTDGLLSGTIEIRVYN